MLIFKQFAFVHVPKTGGSFARAVLKRHLGDRILYETPTELNGGHQTFDELPAGYFSPVLAFVRNPWDWYVSWYFYVLESKAYVVPPSSEHAAFYKAVFNSGRNDFARALNVLCREEPPHSFPGIRRSMAAGHDFYTAALMNAFGSGLSDSRLIVGKFERLREDLTSFILSISMPEREEIIKTIAAFPARNRGIHADYRSYYSNALHDLVQESAKDTIERYFY